MVQITPYIKSMGHVIVRWKNAKRAPGEAPISPYRIYAVSPDSITHRISPNPFDLKDGGRVVDGEWDLNTKGLTNNDDLYNAMIERYKNNVAWEDTQFFNKLKDRIVNRGSAWGSITTVEQLRNRYQQLDKVYELMCENGYQPKRNINRVYWFDEITVNVARDGELVFAGNGNHRIRLAKLLDVDEIFVQILVRHPKWQNMRSNFMEPKYSSNNIEVNPDHPDIPRM